MFEEKAKKESSMNHTASKAWPILYPEDGGDIFLRNVG
jgi:hypothetical protein